MRWLPLLLTLFLAVAPPVHADSLDEILKILSTAGIVDPAIIDARELVECLVKSSDPNQCVNPQAIAEQQLDAAKAEMQSQAEQQAQQFLPSDPAVQAAVQIIKAAYARDWLKVLEVAGVKLLGQVACKTGLAWSGPLQPFVCGKWAPIVLDKAEPVVHETLVLVQSWPNVNIWKLVSLFGLDLGCQMAPDVPLKSEVCGVLGKAFSALASLGGDLVGAIADGLQKVADYLSGGGGDTMMSKDEYYARIVRPLMFKRALERVAMGRQDLGLDKGELQHCLAYGGVVFGSSCAEEFPDRLRKESAALVKLVTELPEAYFLESLEETARLRALEFFGSGEATAYRKFIDNLPQAQWSTLVEGGLPIEMYTGGLPDAKEFYAKLFQDCRYRTYAKIYGPGGQAQAIFPEFEPSQLSHWICYHATGKRFAAAYEAETQHLKTVVEPGLTQIGCPTKLNGFKYRTECKTYTGWSLCQMASRERYGENLFCSFDRFGAAKALGEQLVSTLGSKRCVYAQYVKGTSGEVDPRVICTRPWKHQTCDLLLDSFAARNALAAGRIEVRCEYVEPKEFVAEKTAAAKLVASFNGATGRIQPDSRPVAGKCRTLWDPLSISCIGSESPPVIPGNPDGQALALCPPDPNKDGADTVCYVPDWTVHKDDAALANQGVASTEPAVQPPSSGAAAARGATTTVSDQPPPDLGSGEPQVVIPEGAATGQPVQVASGAAPKPCDFDLTYLAPQAPVLETSGDGLASGDQVRIVCRFEVMTRHISWPACDDQALRAAERLRQSGAALDRVLSGIVAVDGQFVGVSSIPAGAQSFEREAIWNFNEAGTHSVSCQVDNPLGSLVRDADQYVAEAVGLDVGAAVAGVAARGFDPGMARALATRALEAPAVLAPFLRSQSRTESGQPSSSVPAGVSRQLPAVQSPTR